MESFEAFHTSQVRQRARENHIKKQEAERKKDNTGSLDHANDSSSAEKKSAAVAEVPWSRQNIGMKLEMYEVQLGVIFLIYIDLIAYTVYYILDSSNDIFIYANDIDAGTQSSRHLDDNEIVPRLLLSVLNFTFLSFIVEIFALFYSFGTTLFSHHGYTLDLIIIISIVYDDIFGLDLFPIRFLGHLRAWRVARLVATMVNHVEEEHEVTKLKLNRSIEDRDRIEMDVKSLEARNKNEVELRNQVEQTLKGYKDEIDTLKEALRIAAMDVAGIAKTEIDGERYSNGGTAGDFSNLQDYDGDTFFDGNEVNITSSQNS